MTEEVCESSCLGSNVQARGSAWLCQGKVSSRMENRGNDFEDGTGRTAALHVNLLFLI